MASVEWSGEALEQLDQIIAYIDVFDPPAARRLSSRLLALGNSLTAFPDRGRPAGNGVREMVTVRPYILRYQVSDDGTKVIIRSVRHSARLPMDDNA
ncbi:type II toxin-antitoxin system RelE/ParE family toxin [Sphingomonas sp. GlSt437]|uniref:type II toxin-antitoxin system RelE/ParE family toxin n=1 Tax=Sphingomonas sp. GlSt437 TaxID=3389970 RepID=UPI003A882F6E